MDDFQLAMKEYIPGLTARPWWEPEVFPWAKNLEQASPVIQVCQLGCPFRLIGRPQDHGD